MSTTTDSPVAPEKKRKKDKTSTKKSDAPTPDTKSKANNFSDMLLGTAQPTQVAGEVNGDDEKSHKKRRREETGADTAQEAGREESPKKKRKDAHEQGGSTPNIAKVNPPNGHTLIDTPSKKSKNSQLHSAAPQRDFTEESTRRIPQTPPVESGNHTSQFQATTRPVAPGAVPGLPAELESPFVSVKASFKVTVPPVAQLYPLEGALAHYISPLLLTWHPQLDGILLAYNNAKLHTTPPQGSDGKVEEVQPMARAIDECAAPYVWLTLDALLFKPKKGLEMEGYLNLQNESHVTLILWNFFTVTVNHKRLPKSWVWQDHYEEGTNASDPEDKPMRRTTEQWGAWYDSQGNEIQGSLRFRIRDWDCAPPGSNGEGSFLSVEGTMLTDEEEVALRTELAEEARQRKATAIAPRGRTPLPSALRRSNVPSEGDVNVVSSGGKKTKKSAKS